MVDGRQFEADGGAARYCFPCGCSDTGGDKVTTSLRNRFGTTGGMDVGGNELVDDDGRNVA